MAYNSSRIHQVLYLARYAAASRIIKRARKPLLASFKITHDCNLNCMHCPFVKKNNSNSRMDFSTALDVLDRLYMEGARIVIFEGGEPLLWKDPASGKDLSHLIKRAKEKFFFTCMTTNGTIPFKDHDPDIVFISLDGLQKTHDSIRGTGFDMIMSNIKKYHNKKKIIINTCINRLNFMEIPELIKFLEDKVYGVTVQFFYPYSEVENLSLSMVQKKQVLEELIGLKKKGFSLLDSCSCLKRMEDNSWKCRDFLIASVEPDGKITRGCYLKNRVEDISCADCGFAAHCEVSLAYGFDPGAIRAARDIFWGKS
jgi:MoaA/NifB/PqqE/SkfB family radical SAM enzyme